jgi:serine/threonine-protein kinase RsbW
MTTPWTISLAFPAKAEYLVLSRLAVAGLARVGSLDDETVSDLKLAVTEACTNVVQHAYGPGAPGQVHVTYELEPGVVRITVVDDGAGLSAPKSPEAEEREGGMGLAIIRSLADELELDTGPDGRGTQLRFSQRISAA